MSHRQIQVALRASALEEACLRRGADHVTRISSAKDRTEDLLFVVCHVGLAGPLLNLITHWFAQERLGQPGFFMLPVNAVSPLGNRAVKGTGRASWPPSWQHSGSWPMTVQS